MLKKLKAGAEEAATAAQIEAIYLQGKKSGYHHPPDVEAQIDVMRENREEIPLLREDLSAILSHEKDLAASETKAGADFTSMADHPNQHAKLKTLFQLFGALQTSLASNRYTYHATVEQIKEEWKQLENLDLKDIRNKQDQANRSWSTKKYWDKEKKAPAGKLAECDSKYKVNVSELVHLIHDLREKKEELLPGYLINSVQAQMEFHRKSLEELVKCENAMRNVGKVTAVKFTGYDQFSLPAGTQAPGAPEDTVSPRTEVSASPVSSPPSRPSQPKAKGVYPFQGQSTDELSFQPGDILNIIDQSGDWWTAEMNGKQGVIPANYVQLL